LPFKNKKYAKEYMRKYREFRKRQLKDLERALKKGDISKARKILERKPNISISRKRKRKR